MSELTLISFILLSDAFLVAGLVRGLFAERVKSMWILSIGMFMLLILNNSIFIPFVRNGALWFVACAGMLCTIACVIYAAIVHKMFLVYLLPQIFLAVLVGLVLLGFVLAGEGSGVHFGIL